MALFVAHTSEIAGYDELFVKEMPYRFTKLLDSDSVDTVIPRDFLHVFLIRDPERTMPSYFNLITDSRKGAFVFSLGTEDGHGRVQGT